MRFRADLSHYGSEDRASGQPFTEAVSRVSQGTPAGRGGAPPVSICCEFLPGDTGPDKCGIVAGTLRDPLRDNV